MSYVCIDPSGIIVYHILLFYAYSSYAYSFYAYSHAYSYAYSLLKLRPITICLISVDPAPIVQRY